MNNDECDEDRPKWLLGVIDGMTGSAADIEYFTQNCLTNNEIRSIQAAVGTVLATYQDSDTVAGLPQEEVAFHLSLLSGIITKLSLATGIFLQDEEEDGAGFKPWEMN